MTVKPAYAGGRKAMTVQEWSIVIGVVVSGLLALGPWMFMVHAKLAEIARLLEYARVTERRLEYRRTLECDDCGDYFCEYEIPKAFWPAMNGFKHLCPECLLLAIESEMSKAAKATGGK